MVSTLCVYTRLNPEPLLCCRVLSVNLSSTLSHEHPRASTYQLIWVNWKISTEISENSVHLGGFSETTYPVQLRSITKMLHFVGAVFLGLCRSTRGQHADRCVKLAGLDCSSTVWASDFHNLVQPTKSHNECGGKLMDTESSAYTATHFLW